MSGPGAGEAPKKGTHVEHAKAQVLGVSPGHDTYLAKAPVNPESVNDSREKAMLGETPGPNVVVNPANGLG